MRLADALGMRINGRDAIEARLDGVTVWTAEPPAPTTFRFGNESTAVSSTLPSSGGRAVATKFTCPQAGDLIKMGMYFTAIDSPGGIGDRVKPAVWANDAGGTRPGTRLFYGEQAIIAAVPTTLEAAITGHLDAGDYWLGYVFNDFTARAQQSADASKIMWRGEGVNFAAPGNWPAGGGSYANLALCVWAELQA